MNLLGYNLWLIAGGVLSAIAAMLHVAIIVGGPDWYRFFGAGEAIARAAEQGKFMPTLITLLIASVLAIWSAYAFSGAGLISRLPLLRAALVLISSVLLARGLLYFVRTTWRPDLSHSFMLWSSLIVFALGLCFAIGTWQVWQRLPIVK